MTANADSPSRLPWPLPALSIALAFATLLAWTWLTWPDVFVDFGREFYVPMRIGEGAVLYRDLAYFNGPFSPYFNALCLQVFGTNLRGLFFANIAWLALFTALLYRLLARIGDRFSAWLSVLLFLVAFAFGQLTGLGNYNFIAPYSHEVTHGVMLGIVALAALAKWRDSHRAPWLAAAGACVGLAMLTKPETAAAALLSSVATFAWTSARTPRMGRRAADAALFAGAMLAPPLLAAGLLALAMPLTDAIAAVAKPWSGLGSGETMSLAFYREGMGLDHPIRNFLAMFASAGYWLLALSPALLLARKMHAGANGSRLVPCAVFVAYALVLFALRDWIDWSAAARALPLFVSAAIAHAAWRMLGQATDDARFALASSLALLALVLLGKMLLNARVSHYGFALAAPAAMISLTALGSWLPEAIDLRGGRGHVLRAALLAMVAVFALLCLQLTNSYRSEKNVVVGEGANSFRADLRGRYMNSALSIIAKSPPRSTVVAIPEGVMLNVLAGRRSSSRYVSFMPPEVLLFGEDAMLADLAAHPPDRIVLVGKDTSEYGLRYFGRDYGVRLMAWMHANYEPEALVGDPPLQPGSDFGLLVLVRVARVPE